MVHVSELEFSYISSEWKPAHYKLQEPLLWDEDVSVRALSSEQGVQSEIKLHIIKGSFWSEDSYEAGTRIVVLERKYKCNPAEGKQICLVASQEFFLDFLRTAPVTETVDKLIEIPNLKPGEQLILASHVISACGTKNEGQTFSQFLDTNNEISAFFNLVKHYLLHEQRTACEYWLSHTLNKKNIEKLQLMLSIAPTAPCRDRKMITYESIMKVLDHEIVGYEDLKCEIANLFADKAQQKKNRGAVILLYGLPGTGKSKMARVIAKAINLAAKVINLGNISSTVSIVGCEASYDGAESGALLKFCAAQKTSEVLFVLDEIDKLGRAGTDRGKDGNVIETMLKLLDSEEPQLCDAFLDGAPVDCSNTVFVLTANRVENISPELLNRCDIKHHMTPMREDDLIEIMKKESLKIASRRHLTDTWIAEDALKMILQYRGDFGARDSIRLLRILSRFGVGPHGVLPVTAKEASAELERNTDIDNPAVRFHRNEKLYTPSQHEAILDAFSRRESGANLDAHERRNLDLRLEYLTKLIPDGPHHFDKAAFFEYGQRAIFGCRKQMDQIAAEFYAADVFQIKPGRKLIVGPPGVGKSSLFEAVALASGRKFVRFQMNGAKDATFIRGSSSVYDGSDAGIIIKQLAKAESTTGFLYFDEIDKMSHECTQALLDVLDDSGRFYNEFTESWIDISDAYIGASANDLSSIDPVLLTRFQIIEMPGYSAKEKKAIAESYLLPEIAQKAPVDFAPGAFDAILAHYETDAGVRSVKHGLQTVIKQCLLNQAEGSSVTIHQNDVEDILGPSSFKYVADNLPGCVNGLATYGSSHGMVMPIRVTMLHNGTRRITGLPEESIRDSITIAETWLEEQYGYQMKDGFHVHFSPAGIKKDGPSAGVAIAMAMLSAASGCPIQGVAFTGEFDGHNILPVGGLNLKVQAAQSAGLQKVYLPAGCRNDVRVEQFDIELCFVNTIDEIVKDLLPHEKCATL